MTRTPDDVTATDALPRAISSRGACARSISKRVGDAHALDRRAAVRIADDDAGREAQGRGLVGVRLRIAAVEPDLPVRRSAAGDAARPAPELLPVVARVARHAELPGPRARADAAARARASPTGCPSPLAIDELHLLWRREMVVGATSPKWVKLESGRASRSSGSRSPSSAIIRSTRASCRSSSRRA